MSLDSHLETNNDWAMTPVSVSAGANMTAEVLIAAGAPGTRRYLTLFEIVLKTASPTADIIVQVKSDTTVLYETVLGAGSPRGTSKGFASAAGIPGLLDKSLTVTTTGNTGAPLFTVSASGFTKSMKV